MQNLIFPLLIVVLAVPLFLSARKQKKNAAKQQELQRSIAPGDRVMTTSGLFATVDATSEETIDLEIAPGLVTTWLRAAVREKVEPTVPDDPEELSDDEVDEIDEFDADDDEPDVVTSGRGAVSGAEFAPPIEETERSR